MPEATMSYLQNRDREVVGRRKTIDRNSVVDAAEAVVAERGSSALTISAVAEVAGITKGGVQSCFGTKEALIAAILDRWMGDYERCFEAALGDERNPRSRIVAHLAVTCDEDQASRRVLRGCLPCWRRNRRISSRAGRGISAGSKASIPTCPSIARRSRHFSRQKVLSLSGFLACCPWKKGAGDSFRRHGAVYGRNGHQFEAGFARALIAGESGPCWHRKRLTTVNRDCLTDCSPLEYRVQRRAFCACA